MFATYLRNILFTLTLSVPLFTLGSDLVGFQAPVITKNSLNAESEAYLKKKCDEAGLITIPNRTVCKDVINKSLLTQNTFDYCLDRGGKSLGGFIECIESAGGRDYPLSYLKACQKVRSSVVSTQKNCHEYLAQTQSTFDSEAFQFCIYANEGKLHYAKPCLNAIRDRNVNAQKLKEECIDNRGISEKFDDCVFRLTDAAPSSIDCGRGSASRSPSPSSRGAR